MKKALLISCLFITGLLFSQNVTEIPAKDAGITFGDMPTGFFRSDAGDLYRKIREDFPRQNRAQFTLQRLTENLTVKFATKIEFADDREVVNDWEYSGNKIFMFTEQYDGKNKNLYLRVIDKETGKIIADKKQYGSLESDKFGQNARKFVVKTTPDNTKMIIVSAFQWNKKPQVVTAVVYELPTLKVIDQYKFEDNYTGNLVKSYLYNLNSDGNLFYMFDDEPKDKDALPKATLALYDFKSKKVKYKTLQPSLKTREGSDFFVKNDVLYEVGKYVEVISKKEQIIGTYCASYNLKDIEKNTVIYERYPLEFDTKLSYKDGSRKTEFSKKNISLIGTYKTSTGFFLVQNLSYTTESEGQHSIKIYYHSREILVSKFNLEGKREYVKIIPKNTTEKMFETDVIESGGNMYFFYCEHPKNLEKYTLENYDPAEYKDVSNLTGPVPVCVKLTTDGKLSRQTFERNEKWCYYPGFGVRLANGTQMLGVRVEENKFSPVIFKIK